MIYRPVILDYFCYEHFTITKTYEPSINFMFLKLTTMLICVIFNEIIL